MAHVVIVDDSKLIRDLLEMALTRAGYTVSTARGADEGMILLRKSRPALVLLDLEMPRKDGAACLAEIRADHGLCHTPVLMVTGAPKREVVMRVARLGVQGIVIKNDDLVKTLLVRVKQVVEEFPPEMLVVPRGEKPPAQNTPASADHADPATVAKITPASAAPAEAEDDAAVFAPVINDDEGAISVALAIEQLKGLKPMISRAELHEKVLGKCTDLRAMGPSARQVLAMTNSSTASIDAVAKAIRQDQALSLKVLKLANSSLYSRGDRVESVNKAVARIGLSQIRSAVMSLSVIDQFSGVNLAGRINCEWFWEHSVACGLIAARVMSMRGVKTEAAESMYTAGLLHDVGRIIYAEQLGEKYTEVIDAADRLELPLELVESRLLLVNHADLTDKLLHQWKFSADLINPIALHHLSVANARRIAPKMFEEVCSLGLANRLAHALLLGCSGNAVLYPIEEFVSALGLNAGQIIELCAAIPDQAFDMRCTMLTQSGEVQATFMDSVKKDLGEDIYPLHVALEPGTDAAGIMLRRLGESNETPNVAVVRVTNPKERAELVTLLENRERENGAHDLPVLVIGTSEACHFQPGALSPRHMVQIVIPIRIGRVIRTLRSLVHSEKLAHAA